MRKTIGKFVTRFRFIERRAAEAGKQMSDMSLEEMMPCGIRQRLRKTKPEIKC